MHSASIMLWNIFRYETICISLIIYYMFRWNLRPTCLSCVGFRCCVVLYIVYSWSAVELPRLFLINFHLSFIFHAVFVSFMHMRLVLVSDPNGLSLGAGTVIEMFQLPPVALCWIAQSPLIFIMFLPRIGLCMGPQWSVIGSWCCDWNVSIAVCGTMLNSTVTAHLFYVLSSKTLSVSAHHHFMSGEWIIYFSLFLWLKSCRCGILWWFWPISWIHGKGIIGHPCM
jgi:hypothetical protein